MPQRPDDLPARELLDLSQRWGQRFDARAQHRATEAVGEHETRMHLPTRSMEPLTALPFAGEKIADPDMAQIVEMVSQGESLASAASAMGYPLVLVERELARYYARHQRFCQEWALP
jgi:hypothetical protein